MASVVCPDCGAANSEFNPRCVECLARLQDEPGEVPGAAVRRVTLPSARVGPAVRLPARYEWLETLGRGNSAVVYRVLDRELGRPVALKLLEVEAACDPVQRARVQREARVAAALEHPNLCRPLSSGEHEGRPFLVLPLCEGESLRGRSSTRTAAASCTATSSPATSACSRTAP